MITESPAAGRRIIDEVTSWPGVGTARGERGGLAFTLGRWEIGHLHGDHAAHFSFPRELWARLRQQGRIVPHPVFPNAAGPAARLITNEDDVQDVIELLRLNYERLVARHGLPPAAVAAARG